MKLRGSMLTSLMLSLLISCSHRTNDPASSCHCGDFAAVYARSASAVVTILADSPIPLATGAVGLGSGFVVAQGKLIVTAAHVVQGFPGFHAKYLDGHSESIQLMRVNAGTDLALLARIEAPSSGSSRRDQPSLELDAPGHVEIGEAVAVIGAPFGLGQSMTTGIVSAQNRTKQEAQLAIEGVEDRVRLIQTDAIIHPGNSGGPLLNTRGDVAGIVIANFGISQRMGFAIPVRFVRELLESAAQQ